MEKWKKQRNRKLLEKSGRTIEFPWHSYCLCCVSNALGDWPNSNEHVRERIIYLHIPNTFLCASL